MGRSSETFNKKEIKNKKDKKRKDKEKKKIERKENKGGSSLDDMIAYVDENGQLTSTPPDPSLKVSIDVDSIAVSVPRSAPADPADLIRRGIVTFFNESKGYGFIKDLSTQESIFVHVNGLQEAIKENNKVIFEIGMGPKGPNAVNVKLDKS